MKKLLAVLAAVSVAASACENNPSLNIQKTASGVRGMVVASTPYAAQIGAEILRKGGNAIDAAIATAFALFVTDPPNASLAGRSQVIIMLKSGEILGIDGSTESPASAGEANEDNPYRMIPVPGNPAVIRYLKKYTTMSFADLVEPAINLAKNGFRPTPYTAELFERRKELLRSFGPTSDIFLKPDGTPYTSVEKLRQKKLAETLKTLSFSGMEDFYKGEVAKAMASDMETHDGLINLGDLSHYNINVSKTFSANYGDYKIIAQGGNAWGRVLIELINIYKNLPAGPISKEEEALRLAKIISRVAGETDNGDTTHFSVADAEGNLVSWTTSIGPWFGTGAVADNLGFFYAHSLNMKSNPIPKYKDPSEMTPTIVLKNNKPFLVIGSAGGERIPTSIFQVIINVITKNMLLKEAVDAPRIFCRDNLIRIHEDYGAEVIQYLRSKGYVLEVIPKTHTKHLGLVNAIIAAEENGKLKYTGVADPASNGSARAP